MAKCDFCGKVIEPGTGKKFIKDSGRTYDFCSIKCEKFLLVYKKKPRNLKWTEIYHKEKDQKKSDKK